MAARRMILVVAALVLLFVAADKQDDARRDKEALARLQGYIGDWRGVGQPRRGSAQGAWREQCGWAWKFVDKDAAFGFKTDKGKFFSEGSLRWNGEKKQYELTAKSADKAQRVKYTGALTAAGKLVLVRADNETGDSDTSQPARISIRQVAGGDRLLVLYEKRSNGSRYLRLAEVGYTRLGSNFGKGTNFVECVVTGGVGTIAVSHQGKTYYVCCSGCRDYFNDDPTGVLAEYRERKAEEKKKEDSSR